MDLRNTHEKNIWTHEITTGKNFGSTKYPRKHNEAEALDSRDQRWHMKHYI